MVSKTYRRLWEELVEVYRRRNPRSAQIHRRAERVLVDGGSHGIRLMDPFPPRIVRASGAYVEDEDGHRLLDFWQGHHANLLGHNPEVVTQALAEALASGWGLQTGFTDRLQAEVAELLCQQTGAQRVRFTTSGTLATMYAVLLARAFTGRNLVLKVGGGWHGSHVWGLKGVEFQAGYQHTESNGLPKTSAEEVLVTGFNDPERLEADFKRHGDRIACFILEPILGSGGMLPATREYLQLARQLTETYGAVLIFDEIISGFRYRAGNVGALYGVQPDLMTLAKAIGGGMPVAAVAGRADILDLASRRTGPRVKFSGGTYSAHPASLLAARVFLTHLIQNEASIYPRLFKIGRTVRQRVTTAFAREGIAVRFAGDRLNELPGTSLHMMVFPRRPDLMLIRPEELHDPNCCDVELGEAILQLAYLVEGVFVVHGLGSNSLAHQERELQVLEAAAGRVARRLAKYYQS